MSVSLIEHIYAISFDEIEDHNISTCEELARYIDGKWRPIVLKHLSLKEGEVTASVLYQEERNRFTSKEFLAVDVFKHHELWCVFDNDKWFDSLESLSKASSTPIPHSKKVEIDLLALYVF